MIILRQADGVVGIDAGSPATDHCQLIEAGSDGFVVANAHLLFNGRFRALGADLMIEKGGECVLLRDYFGSDPLPILTQEGALLDYDVTRTLAGLGSPWDVAQAGGAGVGGAPEIGTVRQLMGGASVSRGGATTLLALGNPIFQGDVVETSSGSTLGIILKDNTVFSLGGGARMVMTSLVYDAGGANNSMALNLVQGAFTFVAGQAAKTGVMNIATPVATMGIRGTTPIVRLSSADGSGEFSLTVDPPASGGATGSYTLTSPTGSYPTVTLNAIDIIVRIATGSGPVDQRPKSLVEQQADQLLAGAIYNLYNLLPVAPGDPQAPAPGRQGSLDRPPGDLPPDGQPGDAIRGIAAALENLGAGGQTTLLGDLSFGQLSDLLGDTRVGLFDRVGTVLLTLLGNTNIGQLSAPTLTFEGQVFNLLPTISPSPGVLSLSLGVTQPGSFIENSSVGSLVTGNVSLGLPSGTSVSSIVLTLQGASTALVDGLVIGGSTVMAPSVVSAGGLVSGSVGNVAWTVVLGSMIVTLTSALGVTATAAEFEAVLESIQFTNASENPTEFGTEVIRDIAITVTLSNGATTTETTTVTVVPVNDAPEAEPVDATIDEDNSIAGQLVASDVDSLGAITFSVVVGPTSGTLQLDPETGAFTYTPNADFNGTDSFTFTASDGADASDPQTVTLSVGSVNDAPVATADSYTTAEDQPLVVAAAAGVLANDNDPDGDDIDALLVTGPANGSLSLNAETGAFTYTPNADFNGADSFTYTVDDGTVDGNTVTVSLTVTSVDDAPVATADDFALNEDGSIASGPDVPSLAANDTPSGDGGNVWALDTQAAHGSAVVNDDGTFSYTPVANFNGTDSFTYTITDADGDVATATVTLSIGAVNDAPSGADATITTDEDTAYTFSAADFGFTDPNDTPADAFASVVITTLPAAGSLTLGGSAVTAGQVIAVAALATLVWTPPTDANGAGLASLTFQVRDDGTGANTDPTPNTLTFDVTAVNDAPSGADATITTDEDTAHTFSAADFGFTDPNDTPANAFASVVITTLPAAGSLTLGGSAVTTGQVIAVAALATLVWTPPTDANGAGHASLTFQVRDDGTGANTDPTPNIITFDVNAVNDAPSGADATITTGEDTAYTFSAADFGFTDPNDTPANAFASVVITTLPAAGSLTLGGSAVTAGQVIAVAALATLVWTPPTDANGAGLASLTFQVRDDGTGANTDPTPNTITFDVAPVNDPPEIGGVTTGLVIEDTILTASGQLTGSDPDVGDLQFWSVGAEEPATSGSFLFFLNSLTITRGAHPTTGAGAFTFVDDFDDGVFDDANTFNVGPVDPPPGVGLPPAADTYSGGGLIEANGRLEIDSTRGSPTGGVGTDTPFLTVNEVVRTNISPSTPDRGLRSGTDFTAAAVFDLAVPDDFREVYGIRLRDRLIGGDGTPADQQGDDTLELTVRRGADGIARVQFREFDFVADTVTNIASAPLTPPPGADQIRLVLTHQAATNGQVVASFEYLDNGLVIGSQTFTQSGQIFGTETPGSTSDDEDWTRAEIIAYAPATTVSLNVGTYGDLEIDTNGLWTYTLDNGLIATQSLAEGQEATDVFQVTLADSAGATDTQAISVTVRGTNDAPVLGSAANVSRTLTEGETTPELSATGLITFADVDLIDTHTPTPRLVGSSSVGATITTALAAAAAIAVTATLLNPATGDGFGTVQWDFALADALVDYLDSGQSVTFVYEVAIDDPQAAETFQAVTVTINGVTEDTNDAPINAVPGAQTVAEDGVVGFSTLYATPNAIQISDVDAGTGEVQVTLSVLNGVLDVHPEFFYGGAMASGDGTATVVVTGTVAQINALLAGFNPTAGVIHPGMTYTPNQDFFGTDTLTVTTNDQGNTGPGGPQSDTDTIAITVAPVNDAPVITSGTFAPGRAGWNTEGFVDLGGAPFRTSDTPETVPGTYELTAATQGEAGAVWQAIDLGQSFTLTTKVNLGSNAGFGADGIVFAIQGVGTHALNSLYADGSDHAGGALGVGGFPTGGLPGAFGVWIDTFDNGGLPVESGSPPPRPNTVSFFENTVDGATSAAGTTPVDRPSLEDGVARDLVIRWDAATSTLYYTFDGLAEQSHVFTSAPAGQAFLGFVSATGAAVNQQQVEITSLVSSTDTVAPDAFSGDIAEQNGPITASGRVTVNDVDGETPTFLNFVSSDTTIEFTGPTLDFFTNEGVLNVFRNAFSFDTDTGEWSFGLTGDFASVADLLNAMTTDHVITLTYEVVAEDAGGLLDTVDVVVRIVGTDDAPVLDLKGASTSAVGWLHNTPEETASADVRDPTRIASADDYVVGTGLTVVTGLTQIELQEFTTSTYEQASDSANSDYIEYSFFTSATLDPDAMLMAIRFVQPEDSDNYKFGIAISTDGFATPGNTTILRDDVQAGSASGGIGIGDHLIGVNEFDLDPNAAYTVRVYFYDAESNATDQYFWDDFRLDIADGSPNSGGTFVATVPAFERFGVSIAEGTPVALEGDLSVITDADNPDVTDVDGDFDTSEPLLQGARITISDFASGDFLYIDDPGVLDAAGITASYDFNGVMTLSGAATAGQYALALEQVLFRNDQDFVPGFQRTIEVMLYDGEKFSDVATSTIEIAGGSLQGFAFSDTHSPPTFSSTANGSLRDDGQFTPGSLVAVRDALGNEVLTSVGGSVEGLYGTLSFSDSGFYNYAPHDFQNWGLDGLDSTQPLTVLQNLGETWINLQLIGGRYYPGARLHDVFTYTITDAGGTHEAQLVVDVLASTSSIGSQADAHLLSTNGTGVVSGKALANDILYEAVGDGSPPEVAAVFRPDVGFSVLSVQLPSSSFGAEFELAGLYGTLTMDVVGNYTYTIDADNALVADLAPGAELTDRFFYQSEYYRGYSFAELSFTVVGSGAIDDIGSTTESLTGSPPNGSLEGDVLGNDPGLTQVTQFALDGINPSFVGAGGSIAGLYGTLTIAADGSYTYTVDETNPEVDGRVLDALSETFLYRADDGAGGPSHLAQLVVSIDAVNDPLVATPLVLADLPFAAAPRTLRYDADAPAFQIGTAASLNDAARDVDTGSFAGTAITGLPASVLVIHPGGGEILVGFALGVDNALQATIIGGAALTAGQSVTVTVPFNVTYAGQTVASSATFDLVGGPVAINDTAAPLVEDGVSSGTSFVFGNVITDGTADITFADPVVSSFIYEDQVWGANTFITSTENPWFSFFIASDGSYQAFIDNLDPDFDGGALGSTEIVTYVLTDSSGFTDTATLTFTIEAQNDAPRTSDDVQVIGLDSQGSTIFNPLNRGVLANDADPELSELFVTAETLTGLYGELTINTNGTYSYLFDPPSDSPQSGDTDVFTYMVADAFSGGASSLGTLTIRFVNGTSFAPLDDDFTYPTVSDYVIESGGYNNSFVSGTASDAPFAGGNVLENDGDAFRDPATLTVVGVSSVNEGIGVGAVGQSLSGTFGTLIVDAAGNWRYALDENRPAVEELRGLRDDGMGGVLPADVIFDSFVIEVQDADGQRMSTTLEIEIHGAEDHPRLRTALFSIENEGRDHEFFTSENGISLLQFAYDPDEGDTISVVPGSVRVDLFGPPLLTTTPAAGTVLNPTIDFTYDAGSDALRINQQQFEYLQKYFEYDPANPSFGAASGTPDVLQIFVTFEVEDASGARSPTTVELRIQGDSDYVGLASTIETFDLATQPFAFNRTIGFSVTNNDFAGVAQDVLSNFDNSENRIDISDLIRGSVGGPGGSLSDFIRAQNNIGANSIDPSDDFVELFVDPDGIGTTYSEFQIGVVTGTSTYTGGSDNGGALGGGDSVNVIFDQAQAAARVTIA